MCISSVEQVSSSKDCPTLKKNGCVVSDYVHVSLRVHAMEGIIYTPLGAYWGGGGGGGGGLPCICSHAVSYS